MSCKKMFLLAACCAALGSCSRIQEKLSPEGLLIASSDVDDRVEMSLRYYREHLGEQYELNADGAYSFLVGADSHVTTRSGRMDEMLAIGRENNDLFYAHLGDIADTKADYYCRLDSLLRAAGPHAPFFPVVGNHDVTRNGWALWSNIFHASFYGVDIHVGSATDRLLFLDSANGTLGRKQLQELEKEFAAQPRYRNIFVFTHTNIFRPQFAEFAGTFSKEELYLLTDKFAEWKVSHVFCGHVHTWDESNFGGVEYFTLESMCEKNNPRPGDYLLRVQVAPDGKVSREKVHMK